MTRRCHNAEIEPMNLESMIGGFTKSEKLAVADCDQILFQSKKRFKERSLNKVALIQPRKGGRPALGLLYVGAYLRECHYDVRIFEFLDELYPPNIKFNEDIYEDLIRFSPDVIGFGIISSTLRITENILGKIKNELPDRIYIAGGKHASANPEEVMALGVDYLTLGESEITIVELLDALNFDLPFADIKGIAYQKQNEIVSTDSRRMLPLDYLLRPAFELVDYWKYVDSRLHSIPGHYLRCGFIFGSRGCPYRCKFCITHVRSLYRERSIDHMLDEMEWQIENYRLEAFVILDDLFYYKEERVLEFCDKIKKRNIKTKFMAHSRVDRVDEKIIGRLKEAGLLLLAVGVESGSQKVLDAMRKGTTIQQIEEAFEIYNLVGINTFAFIIVGHPDESAEDHELTRQLIQRIKPTNVAVNYYMPMPGTESYEFEIKNAKHLVDGDEFKEFTFTTNCPEFSMTDSLEVLQRVGNEFESMSVVNRNYNLFTYPQFWLDMFSIVVFKPWIVIDACWERYVKKTMVQSSFNNLMKDAISFAKQRFKNP